MQEPVDDPTESGSEANDGCRRSQSTGERRHANTQGSFAVPYSGMPLYSITSEIMIVSFLILSLAKLQIATPLKAENERLYRAV
jgi:hypothetical protein